MTVMTVPIPYAPWSLMSQRERNICIAEVVLGWQRHYDIEKGVIRWTLTKAYLETHAPNDWPPDYINNANALTEVKRKFGRYAIAKVGPRDFLATVYLGDGKAEASGISENDAFAHAAVMMCGGCV